MLKERRVNFHLKHKGFTYLFGSLIGVSDFFRENALKPVYRALPADFKGWYDIK